ncbi:MAG: DNA-formamidopyrimidine glycosylase [Mycoplasmoidaceae bacterium]
MPEMPEVQTLIDSLLDEEILNKKIKDVNFYMDKLFKNCTPNEFKNFIINEKIINIDRIGKYLIFHLSNKKVFVVHLRMEGKIFFQDSNSKFDEKHTLLRISFGKKEMRYQDTRRFGTFHIFLEDNYKNSKELSKLGLDPLQENFDWKYLKKNIYKSNKFIKTALLDQSNVSGIGNIYVDEILFASKIHPESKCNKLSDEDFKTIALNSKRIIKKAIDNKGTTISTYMYKKETKGQFQKFLNVHTKKDSECKNCKNKIVKIKVNGRGTYLCSNCQGIKN